MNNGPNSKPTGSTSEDSNISSAPVNVDLNPSSSNQSGKLLRFSDYDEVSTIEPLNSRRHGVQATICDARCLKGIIPFIHWLPKYEWKKNLLHDLVAGLTVAVMHVPQGLAYAVLSNVPPIVGIYMGTFPVVIYFLFGTSRHLSIGTFAPVAIMTGGIVNTINDAQHSPESSGTQVPPMMNGFELRIASEVALCVGFWHLIAYILHFGFFATILSKTLVSAFTAGAAFHILFSQIPHFLGLEIKTRSGVFRLIYTSIEIGKQIHKTNISALVISIMTCLILLINIYFIQPRLEDKIHIGLPIELIVIGIGIIVSKYCKLQETFLTPVIGYIPSGFQTPSMPHFQELYKIYLESILVALVSYAIATSVAFHLAAQCSYEIDPNQEFLALGMANIVGSFFSCIPIGGSMSRTVLQYKSGGRSQLAGIFCALILIVVILWISPIFEKLPLSILAGIIVMTLYHVLSQITEFPTIWKISKQDGILWLSTFIGVIILDIAYGLAIGVFVAFLFIYYHSTTPYVCTLGKVILARDSQNKENDYMFIDMRHVQASEIPGLRIIQISSSLHFANRAYVKAKVQELAGVSPHSIFVLRNKMKNAKESEEAITEKSNEMMTVGWRLQHPSNTTTKSAVNSYFQTKKMLNCIILDLSLVHEADQAAITALQNLVQLYREIGIQMVVSSRNPTMMIHLYSFPNIRTAIKELVRVRHIDLEI